MTLVNVLKQILDDLDAPTCLNIDMVIEQTLEVCVVRHDPYVVKVMPTNFFFSTIVMTSINWV
jgi:hypothetical protein